MTHRKRYLENLLAPRTLWVSHIAEDPLSTTRAILERRVSVSPSSGREDDIGGHLLHKKNEAKLICLHFNSVFNVLAMSSSYL